jgi:di/tricarboxylate transporter
VHHLAVGAIGLFLAVPQLVIEWFGDAIGAPATLLLVGVLLVLLAVGLGRARREVVGPGGAS